MADRTLQIGYCLYFIPIFKEITLHVLFTPMSCVMRHFELSNINSQLVNSNILV